MVLSVAICTILLTALLFSAANGRLDMLSAAALEGAAQAVHLSLSLCGTVCLWSGVLEVMRQSGLAGGLAGLLRPLLGRLFPKAARDADTMASLSQNVSANLLGLGNAATPAGIRAAKGMRAQCSGESASNELCRLVVLNTASIQLIPATVAALRGSLGSASPFDILPAVWLSSITALSVGLLVSRLLERLGKP